MLTTSRSESSSFTVFVHRLTDPVDSRIISNGDVAWVDENHLIVFVSRILIHPVRVEDTKIGTNTANSFLRDTLKIASKFDLINALILGLAVDDTLVIRTLAATSTNSNSVKDVTLLRLVSELVGLVSSGGTMDLLDLLLLAVLPCPHTKQESHHIALLLAPQLLEVFVGTHGRKRPVVRLGSDVDRLIKGLHSLAWSAQ